MAQYADTTAQLGFDPHDCGWTGLPIRRFPPDALSKYQPHGIPYFLRGTIGACQEFVDVNGGLAWLFGNDTIDASLIAAALANASTQDDYESCMGARGPFLPHKCNHLFVNTPRANYCLGASVGKEGTSRSKVLQLVSLLIFLLFLVRLRSVVCYTSRLEVRSLTCDLSSFSRSGSLVSRLLQPRAGRRHHFHRRLRAADFGVGRDARGRRTARQATCGA